MEISENTELTEWKKYRLGDLARGESLAVGSLSMKHRCPICKTPTDSDTNADFPFCTERCRDRDLGNWATEKYVVSEPVFDMSELETEKNPEEQQSVDEDEDFRGFRKPDDTIH
jgi:uncharacterized protein